MDRGDGRPVKHMWKLGHRAVRQHDQESKGINLLYIYICVCVCVYVSEPSAAVRLQTNKVNIIKSE